jgi:hypothetical protein
MIIEVARSGDEKSLLMLKSPVAESFRRDCAVAVDAWTRCAGHLTELPTGLTTRYGDPPIPGRLDELR